MALQSGLHFWQCVSDIDEPQLFLRDLLPYWHRTALILAIENNHAEPLPLLIAAGADINHTVAEEDSPLHLAIRYSHNLIAILLARQGNIVINAKVCLLRHLNITQLRLRALCLVVM